MAENAQLRYMHCYTSATSAKMIFSNKELLYEETINIFFTVLKRYLVCLFLFFLEMASFFQKPERNL